MGFGEITRLGNSRYYQQRKQQQQQQQRIKCHIVLDQTLFFFTFTMYTMTYGHDLVSCHYQTLECIRVRSTPFPAHLAHPPAFRAPALHPALFLARNGI